MHFLAHYLKLYPIVMVLFALCIMSLGLNGEVRADLIFQDDFEDDTAGMIGSPDDLDPVPLLVEADEEAGTPSEPGWWVHDGAYLTGTGVEAQVIMDDMDGVGPDSTDNNKLRLTRTGGAATGGRAGLWWGEGIVAFTEKLTIEFRLNKPAGDEKASYFDLHPGGPFLDSVWRSTERTWAVFINPDGSVTRYDDVSSAWVSTGLSVNLDSWNDIRTESNLAAQTWSLTINGNTVADLPFNNDHHDVHEIAFAHGGTGLLSYCLDDVSVSFEGSIALPGDLNSDGFVGGDDLDIVRSFWGQNVTAGNLEQGDPSGDGFVGGDDLDVVRANWGQGTPPAPSAVPEPASSILLVTTGLMILGWIRHKG